MDSKFWEQLKANLIKANSFNNKYYISAFIKEKIKKHDIIIIYQKHKNTHKNGFVCITSVESNMAINSNKIKIFNDINLNKYFCELKAICMLNNIIKLSAVCDYFKNNYDNPKSVLYFRNKLLIHPSVFYKMENKVGLNTIQTIIKILDDQLKKSQELSNNTASVNIIDNKLDSSSSSSSDSSDQYSNLDTSDDEIEDPDICDNSNIKFIKTVPPFEVNTIVSSIAQYKIISSIKTNEIIPSISSKKIKHNKNEIIKISGHIPILGIPCKNFIWDDNPEITIQNFKLHYTSYEECGCEWTDNNTVMFNLFINCSEYYCKDLKKNHDIKKYIKLYHNLEKYTFRLLGEDIDYNHVYLFRINKRGYIYHKCILVIF
jgi:hypothetical protein